MPRILLLICCILLVLAALPLPYGYYTLLRLVACTTLGIGSSVAFRSQSPTLGSVLLVLALTFNPFVPVHLGKKIWATIDIGTAALLFAVRRAISHETKQDFRGGT